MARYERINNDDDVDAPFGNRRTERTPSSPPPSFHSRNSSQERRQNGVNSTLADAFDADGDDSSDDEPDDRQRLVRNNSGPVSRSSTFEASAPTSNGYSAVSTGAAPQPAPRVTQTPAATAANGSRVYGGGIQSDGVFSNMTARPERGGEKIVEELPPVSPHLSRPDPRI